MNHQWRLLLSALQFMTIIRVKNDLVESPQNLGASVAYYPLVGFLIGVILAGIWLGAGYLFKPLLASTLTVAGWAMLTRGLHLDGLADTADGLLSHRDRVRKLEIMKDSRIGTFGVLALILILGMKVASGTCFSGPASWPVWLLIPMWGRWAAVLTAVISPYARAEGGLGRPFVSLAGRRELLVAGGTTIGLSVLVMGLIGLVLALLITLAALLGILVWQKEIGGVTGDILGAVIEMGETMGLLLVAMN